MSTNSLRVDLSVEGQSDMLIEAEIAGGKGEESRLIKLIKYLR